MCALVTGVQTCALPSSRKAPGRKYVHQDNLSGTEVGAGEPGTSEPSTGGKSKSGIGSLITINGSSGRPLSESSCQRNTAATMRNAGTDAKWMILRSAMNHSAPNRSQSAGPRCETDRKSVV